MRRWLLLALCCAFAAAEDEVLADAIDRATGGDPKTLTELLHWGLKHTDLDELHAKAEAVRAHDANKPGVLSAAGNVGEAKVPSLPVPDEGAAAAAAHVPPTPMSKERRVELDELARIVMPSMVEEMKRMLAVVQDEAADMSDKVDALEALQEHVEDIDNARDFNTIGGFASVIKMLAADDEPELQTAAAWLCGTAVQNSRELQLVLVEAKALPSLLRLLEAHARADVRAKALFAISGMLRGCPEAQAQFTAHDGFAALLGALADSSPKLVRKALVLLTDLLAERAAPRDAAEPPPSAAVEGEGVPVRVQPTAQEQEQEVHPAWGEAVPPGVDTAALLRGALGHNASRLCDAVVQCLRAPDLGTQDKAARALEQIVEAGLAGLDEPAGTPRSSCAGEGMRDALGALQSACEAEPDDCADDGLLPLVRRMQAKLAAA